MTNRIGELQRHHLEYLADLVKTEADMAEQCGEENASALQSASKKFQAGSFDDLNEVEHNEVEGVLRWREGVCTHMRKTEEHRIVVACLGKFK